MLHDTIITLPLFILGIVRLANAACECGYSVNKTSDATFALYTTLQENDFLHSTGDNVTEFGWSPQEYNVSAKDARGPYGKEFFVSNVELNPLKDSNAWTGDSEKGGDAGLKLWVRGDHSHGFVSGAEMASVRNDTLYGSFRVGMKLSSQNGTCGAFFWFYNNSQEIDLEFLSKQFNESQGTVNLVLQSPDSVRNGFNAANTNGYKIQHLNFRPDEKFHEYRFDWSPEGVTFYVDGQFLSEITANLPTSGGRMFMNHWSNGDPMWSAGPPDSDTAMTVSYVKAYFNSTDSAENNAYKKQCPTYDPTKVCQIPEQTVAPDGNDAKTYFFSEDGNDKTPGQTTFKLTNSASGLFASSSIYFSLCITLFSWALAI